MFTSWTELGIKELCLTLHWLLELFHLAESTVMLLCACATYSLTLFPSSPVRDDSYLCQKTLEELGRWLTCQAWGSEFRSPSNYCLAQPVTELKVHWETFSGNKSDRGKQPLTYVLHTRTQTYTCYTYTYTLRRYSQSILLPKKTENR